MADDPHHSAASLAVNVAAPASIDEAREALRSGPRGALALASLTTGALFVGWLLFYFLLFMPRGPIR